jgi:hypothetical protein
MLRYTPSNLLAYAALFAAFASPVAALDTIWDFNGNLAATSGTATMSYRGDTSSIVKFYGSEHDLGLPMPFGDNSGLMRIQPTAPTQGFAINLNNGGTTVQNYTMIWDLFRPGPSWDSWLPLYQTNTLNSDDADFFINPGDGIGISGVYNGTVSNGRGNITWNRVAVSRAADGTMKKYIDGSLVGTQSAAGSRWDITGGQFDILTDEDNESSLAFLSSFRFVDNVLSDSAIANLGAVHAGGANSQGKQIVANPATMTSGGYTIAFLGDTQNYSTYRADIFNQVTQWLVDNKAARNIQFVVQDGDIVNNGNSTSEWDVARAAMQRLDGVIPYATVRGNHDIGSQYDLATRFGPGSPYSQQPTLVDHFEVPGQPNWDMRNTAHKFDVGNQKFLVVTLDISAGSNAVSWANSVISANPDRRVIIDTHAYSYDGGQRFNNAADPNNPGKTYDVSRDELLRVGTDPDSVYNGAVYGGQDAQTLWNNLVKIHPNISLVLSGHQFEEFDSFKYHVDKGINGNTIYELLVDPQNMANGGNGWIRLLEFAPDGLSVRVKTYSPFLNQWDTSPDTFFDIQLSPISLPGDFNNDSVVDTSDYVVWRNGLGTTYSSADYQVWRSHFGQSAAGSGTSSFAAVPEPTPLILLTLAAMIGMMRRTSPLR